MAVDVCSMSGPGESRLHGLDHLRAVAVLQVMLLHYAISYRPLYLLTSPGIREVIWFGWSGVDLFFVLSGYLICDRLLAEIDRTGSIRLSRFWMGRALRILPAYLVVVAVYFAVEQVRESKRLPPLWQFLTFTQNLNWDPRTSSFGHAWSLCVEWHFYFLFPVLLLLARKRIRRNVGWMLLAAAGLGLLARHVAWVEWVEPLASRERVTALFAEIYMPTYARWDGLLVGAAIAAAFRYIPGLHDRLAARGNLLLLAGTSALVLCCAMYGGPFGLRTSMNWAGSVAGFSLVSVAYGLVVAAALCPDSILHRWRSSVTRTLAAWSFAIYLVHVMAFRVADVVAVRPLELAPLLGLLVCFAAAVLAGGLLHHSVERPFLAIRQTYLRRGQLPD